MTILPALTTTKPDRVPAFIEDLSRLNVKTIALFPTVFKPDQRKALYSELERIDNLRTPHVHLRSDFDEAEIEYLIGRFSAEVFNIHPQKSAHPFIPQSERFVKQIFIENSDALPERNELAFYGGVCLDFSHWENGRLTKDQRYEGFETIVADFSVGCCHVSAIRIGDPNEWSGGWDHHHFKSLEDLDYLVKYRNFLPKNWISLELENSLDEQLEAVRYLERLFNSTSR